MTFVKSHRDYLRRRIGECERAMAVATDPALIRTYQSFIDVYRNALERLPLP